MGANRCNKIAQSRRFAPCYALVGWPGMERALTADEYYVLFEAYCESLKTCQCGKAGHDRHTENIKKLKAFLSRFDMEHS